FLAAGSALVAGAAAHAAPAASRASSRATDVLVRIIVLRMVVVVEWHSLLRLGLAARRGITVAALVTLHAARMLLGDTGRTARQPRRTAQQPFLAARPPAGTTAGRGRAGTGEPQGQGHEDAEERTPTHGTSTVQDGIRTGCLRRGD